MPGRRLSGYSIRSNSRSRSTSRGRPTRRMTLSQITPNSRGGRRMSTSSGRSMSISRSRSSSSGQFSKIAAGLSGAALGAISGGPSGAAIGGLLGYRAGSKSPTNRRIGVYSGSKIGRFNRKKSKLSAETKALRKGYHCTSELHANVADAHCVYLAHSTSHYGLLIKTFTGAMLRKLFLKAGLSIPSRDQELPLFSQFDSDGFKIVYTFQNPVTGAAGTIEYITVNDQSLTAVINAWTALSTHFNSIFLVANGVEPQCIALYSSDRNIADTNWRLASQLNLRNEIINWHFVSEMKVQNRTSGALAEAGDIGDADRVDQQPLQGYLYTFKGGEPRLKHTTNNLLNDDEKLSRIREYGQNQIPSSLLPQPFQEPPVPKIWSNCTGASKVLLQPGDIKFTKISHRFRGKVPTLFKKLKTTFNESGFLKGIPGKSQILALEEYMRTPASNQILVGFERELKLGCWLDSGKTVDVFTSDYSEANTSNG